MKWTIPLGTGGAMILPLVVVSIVSFISPYCILDNPDFWYGYMGYVGTVALAGAALWQNQSFRIESRRKEEYAIRPYLFSKIEAQHIDFLEEQEVAYLMINIENNNEILIRGFNRNLPEDVAEYSKYKQQHGSFDYTARTETEKLGKMLQFAKIVKMEKELLTALNSKYEFISYQLQNHGSGSAVKVNLMLNNQHTIPLFCLSHSETEKMYFLVNAEKLQPGHIVDLNVTIDFYNTEDSGPYFQKERFSIKRTDANNLNLRIDEQISPPSLKKIGR